MKKIIFLTLLTLLFISCTKQDINKRLSVEDPITVEIKSIETVDLSQDNKLFASLPPPEYDYKQTQKVTYTNGLIAYRSPGIYDLTKHLVRFTENNVKFVTAISSDSAIGKGINMFSLKSKTGLLYYSMKIRVKDSYFSELKVVNELPLHTLSEIEIAGSWFKCMKSRMSACAASWKCTLSCGSFVTVGMCGLMMTASCYTWKAVILDGQR